MALIYLVLEYSSSRRAIQPFLSVQASAIGSLRYFYRILTNRFSPTLNKSASRSHLRFSAYRFFRSGTNRKSLLAKRFNS